MRDLRDILLKFMQNKTEIELVVTGPNSLACDDEYAPLKKVKVIDVGTDIVHFAELHLTERDYVNYTVFFDHFIRIDSIQRISVLQNPFETEARGDKNWSNLKRGLLGR